MHGSGEGLALSQHSEPVAQRGHVVLGSDVGGLHGLLGLHLEGLGGIEAGHGVGVGSSIEGVEDAVEDAWVGTKGGFLGRSALKGTYGRGE